MQQGSTLAVAWAVMASVLLPQLARADSTALSSAKPLETVNTNRLGVENDVILPLKLPDNLPLPLPGTKTLKLDLGSAGVAVSKGNVDALNLGLTVEHGVGCGTAKVTLNGNVGAVAEDPRNLGLSFGWGCDVAPGANLSFSGGGDGWGNGLVEGRLNINLHPDLPAAPAHPLDLDWKSLGQRSDGLPGDTSNWGLSGWESR